MRAGHAVCKFGRSGPPASLSSAVRRRTSDLRMPQDVSIVNDLKTAAVLAGSAGLLGAVTVPFLLPSIFELVPAQERSCTC